MNNDAGKISFESGLDLTGLDRDIKAAQDRFKELNGNVQKECTGIDGSIRNIGASIAAAFTVQKAGEFIKKMVAVRGEIESLEKSFGILAGTVQGKKLFEEIKDFAVKTPMTMPALAKGAQTLLAFNYEAENVMPILKAIGDISMGNEQKFNSLTLAFAQMSSTGKLMGQDLLQMINAGFNPLAVISEQTGKSIGDLKEEMAAGAISSEMITKAFMDATSEGGKFHGMLEQQSKGIEGSLSNLEGAIQDMFNELGEKSQGVITSSIQNVTALVQNYDKVGRVIAGLIGAYGLYKAALMSITAINNTATAAAHTQEAASLYQLLTAEQQAAISKKGLSTASAEYYSLVKAVTTANIEASQITLVKAREEVKAASITMQAKRGEYTSAKQLEAQRIKELAEIKVTGNAKQIEAAQRNLNKAATDRETAGIAYQSAARDFHTKRTAVETAAKNANTLASKANTAAKSANVTTTNFLAVAKTKLTAVTKKLTAAVMKNPYALVAAGVAALGFAIYKLATHQSEAEKTQSRLNEAFKEADKNIISERTQIDYLFGRLKAAKEGTEEYEAAKKQIINQYGSYLSGLSDEIQSLKDVEGAYKAITEAAKESAMARARESYIKEEADNYASQISDIRDEVKKMMEEKFGTEKGYEYFWKIVPVLEGGEMTDEIRDIISQFDEKKLRMVGSGMSASYDEMTTNDLKSQLTNAAKVRKVLNNAIEKANAMFGTTPQESKKEDEGNSEDAVKVPIYGVDYEEARKEWETAKKELQAIEKDKDNFTTKQYEDAKSREETAKKRFSELGGDVSEKTRSTSEDRTAEEMKNAARERMTLEKNLYFQEQQNRINLETNERKRKEAQMRLDHEKELYNLEQQKQSAIDAEIERQRAIFDAVENTKASKNDKYVKKTFSEADIDKTEIDKITESYSNLYKQIEKIQQKERDEINNDEEKAQNEYLSKYGSFLERIEATTKLYSEKIRKATTEGERKTLESERDAAIKAIEQEMNGDGINWDNIFADVSHRSVESLKAMRDEIRNVIIEGKDLSASDMSRLYEQYNKVGEAIEESSFSLRKLMGYTNEEVEHAERLKSEYEELKSICEELVELQNKHRTEAESANQNLVDFMQEHTGQNVNGNESEQTMIEMLQGNNATEETMSAFKELFSKNKEASNQLAATTKNVQGAGEAMSEAGAAMQSAGSNAASTIAIIDKIIHTVNDNVQSAVGVMEELGLEDTKAGKFTEKFAESSQYATQAWESLKSGNIMGVVHGVLGSLRTLGEGLGQLGIAGFGSNNADLPKQLEHLTHSNENLQRSIDYLSEKIEKANNADAKDIYEQQKKDLLNAISGTQNLMDTAGSTYSNGFLGIGGSHSADYFINENMSSTDWSRMNQILKENDFDSTVNQAGDLWGLTPEEMEAIATAAPDLWTKLQDAISEGYAGEELNQLLNDYLDFAGQMEEYSEQFVEKITNVSFDELSDEFKSFITNADMTATDFANDFNKKLVDAIAESLMTRKYNDQIKALQEQWTKYMEDEELTDGERAALEAERDKIIKEMLSDREDIEDMFGNYSSQDSTKKGFQTMSQESADELSGRFTAIQIDTSNIKSLCDSILVNSQHLINVAVSIKEHTDEVRNISLSALDHLETISRNTHELYEMNDRLGKIEQNTRNL